MDLKTAIAATPMLRKAWRMVPGPLKLPVLVAGGAYAVYYLVTGKGEQASSRAEDHLAEDQPEAAAEDLDTR